MNRFPMYAGMVGLLVLLLAACQPEGETAQEPDPWTGKWIAVRAISDAEGEIALGGVYHYYENGTFASQLSFLNRTVLEADPATPEEYEFIYPEDMPEGMSVSTDDEIALKILCHKHNISRSAAQAFIDMDFQRKKRDAETYTKAVSEQNEKVETLLKAEMGPEDFVENGKLMRRFMRRHFAGEDDQFEAVYNDIKTTLFRGGADTKMVLAKALSEAARLAEGAGSSIYTQYKEKMTETEDLKKEFPKSHTLLVD